MKKYIRYEKFSLKLLFVYIFGVVLIGMACPPDSWTTPRVLIGIGLMGLGELIRIWAAGHLRKNQELTASGPYSYVKNPLYIGTILITVGTCILVGNWDTGNIMFVYYNWILLAVAVLVFIVYYIPYKKHREGSRLHDKFGEAWEEYDQAVPDYFPRLSPYRQVGTTDKSWRFDVYIENSEHWTSLLVIVIALIVMYKEPVFLLLDLPVCS